MSVDINDPLHQTVGPVLSNGTMKLGPETTVKAYAEWVEHLRAEPDRMLESDHGPIRAGDLLERYIDREDGVVFITADDMRQALQRYGWLP